MKPLTPKARHPQDMGYFNVASGLISDAEAYENGMRRCSQCAHAKACPICGGVEQSSPKLRWCGMWTDKLNNVMVY